MQFDANKVSWSSRSPENAVGGLFSHHKIKTALEDGVRPGTGMKKNTHQRGETKKRGENKTVRIKAGESVKFFSVATCLMWTPENQKASFQRLTSSQSRPHKGPPSNRRPHYGCAPCVNTLIEKFFLRLLTRCASLARLHLPEEGWERTVGWERERARWSTRERRKTREAENKRWRALGGDRCWERETEKEGEWWRLMGSGSSGD